MKLYFHYFTIHLKTIMQYKASFFLSTIGQFLVSFNVFLGVYFMLERFHQVKGFTYSQCLLCFSTVLLSFSLAECFFRGFDSFSFLIQKGEFDQILVRPRSLILQILGSRIEFSRIGRMIQAIVIFGYAIPTSGVIWNLSKIFTLIFMIIGGVITFASLFLLYASLCFFTVESLEFMNIFTDGAREYGKYPIGIYGKTVLRICTYIVPFALFQYYPFLYLIGKIQKPIFMILPLLSCCFFLPCFLLWRFGVRRYQSTGS